MSLWAACKDFFHWLWVLQAPGAWLTELICLLVAIPCALKAAQLAYRVACRRYEALAKRSCFVCKSPLDDPIETFHSNQCDIESSAMDVDWLYQHYGVKLSAVLDDGERIKLVAPGRAKQNILGSPGHRSFEAILWFRRYTLEALEASGDHIWVAQTRELRTEELREILSDNLVHGITLIPPASEYKKLRFPNDRAAWVQLLAHNVQTLTGIALVRDCVLTLVDQILDCANMVLIYFLRGHNLLGSLSSMLIFGPLTLNWLCLFMRGEAELKDLPVTLLGLHLPIDLHRSLLRGARLLGFFWSSVMEGVLEAPAQAILTFYTMEIGLSPIGALPIASLLFSLAMVAKNFISLDQYGRGWQQAAQARNLAERLTEVSFRVVWVGVFLKLMRPNLPLSAAHPWTLLVFLALDVPLTACVVRPAVVRHPPALRVLWVLIALVARPPHFLQDLRPIHLRLILLRGSEALLMVAVAWYCGARAPSMWDITGLVGTAACGATLAATAAWDRGHCGSASPEQEALAPSQDHAKLPSDSDVLRAALEDHNGIMADLMLKSGADPHLEMSLDWRVENETRDLSTKTRRSSLPVPAIIWAVEHNFNHLVLILLEGKADPDSVATLESADNEHYLMPGIPQTSTYRTVSHSTLSLAAEHSRLEIMRMLLRHGASPDLKLDCHERKVTSWWHPPEGQDKGPENVEEAWVETALSRAQKWGMQESAKLLEPGGP